MRIFENLNVDFLAKRKVFYLFSGVLFLLGLMSMIFRGLEFGIDFKGGSEIELQFEKPVNIAQIRDYAAEMGLGTVEIKTFGGDEGVLIRTELQEIPAQLFPRVTSSIEQSIETIVPGLAYQVVDSTTNSVTYQFASSDTTEYLVDKLFNKGFQTSKVQENQVAVSIGISDWIKENLQEKITDNRFEVRRATSVGPKVGDELKSDAIIAVLLSLLVILVYLGFRFKFVFAIGAVAALFHDVLITFGLFSLLYGVIPGLNLEIDITVVAAFLTLVGYSINDSVVVFDRVREEMKIHKTINIYDNINSSLNKTMSRTVLTGGTSLLTLLVLIFLGGEVLRTFAFTLFFGIIIGTYSSIFVASSFVYEYASRIKKKISF